MRDRIFNGGGNSKKVIQDARNFIELSNSNCKIIATGFKTKEQLIDAFIAGAHSCAISNDKFDIIIKNEYVDKAVEQFNLDGSNTKMY